MDAGAAARLLLDDGAFPLWAYPFAEALLEAGGDAPPPSLVALVAEDAILLAPRRGPGGQWVGFLLAEGTAVEQVRSFRPHPVDPAADPIPLVVPRVKANGAVLAEEAVCLSSP